MSGRLPCGADTDALLDQISGGHDEETPHQRGCPHCRAALEEYRRLWAPVDALADEVVRAPRAVLDRALARVRAVADNPAAGLLESDGLPGSTWIAARVVVGCARSAAEEVDGVRAALGRLSPEVVPPDAGVGVVGDAVADLRAATPGETRVAVGLAGGTAVVELTLAASYGRDLPALGRTVRALVARRVRETTGLHTVTVDVHVDTVFSPSES